MGLINIDLGLVSNRQLLPTSAFDMVRLGKLALTNVTSNSAVWDYAVSDDGNTMYMAADTDGIYVIDITNPAAPTHTTTARFKTVAGATTSMGVTDVKVVGTTLFACGRSINWVTPQVGLLAAYDISTPSAPSWISTFAPDDMDPLPVVVNSGLGNNWYQGMDVIDSNTLIIASQFFGVTVMNVTDRSAMVILGTYETSDLEAVFGAGYMRWETSRCVYDSATGWGFFATHGDYVIALDFSTPATPTNPQHYDKPTINGVQLRCRDLVIAGSHLFTCNNTVSSTADEERGLVSINVSSPTAVTGSDWVHTAIPDADVDTWNGKGDKPILGLSTIGNKVFLANGQRGTVVFDSTNKSAPVCLGLYGTDTEDETNLYMSFAFTHGNGKHYCYYSDSKENTQKHNLYYDLVLNP